MARARLTGKITCSYCGMPAINAGISRVIIRQTKTDYQVVDVSDWVHQEDDLPSL